MARQSTDNQIDSRLDNSVLHGPSSSFYDWMMAGAPGMSEEQRQDFEKTKQIPNNVTPFSIPIGQSTEI